MVIFIQGCSFFDHKENDNFAEIGSLKSENRWVYLCGLTQDFDSSQEIENRKKLDAIGCAQNIKFLAIKPNVRCSEFNNKLCWPHNNQDEVNNTYSYILSALNNKKISGFIGFSNGGFFLNKLVQYVELNKPVISIGASGYLENGSIKNKLFLLIGLQDTYHYKDAYEFYQRSKSMPLNVEFVEFNGGHEIPQLLFEETLRRLQER